MSRFIDNNENLGKTYIYTGIGFYRVRRQKSLRKDQHCLYGDHIILKGFPSVYISGLDASGFYYFHVCARCYNESEVTTNAGTR